MGESRNAYRVLVGRPEGKRPLGRPRRRWEDNIKMDLREVGYDDRDWINLAQTRQVTGHSLRCVALSRRQHPLTNNAVRSHEMFISGMQLSLLFPLRNYRVPRPIVCYTSHESFVSNEREVAFKSAVMTEMIVYHLTSCECEEAGQDAAGSHYGQGRPRSTTPEVQEEILEAVNMTPSISTRRVALQVNVPHTTVWRLLKEYQLYPYNLQRVQALSPADYPARVRSCQWFLQQCGVNPNPLDFYLWGHLKSLVYSSPVPGLESLRNRIVACSEDIRNTPGVWDRVRRSMRHRCEVCIQAGGGHFEHLL
ncbi:hypothetical protein ANN_02309 [Periplaneta americana]|uniref:Uncharacterized protein n=1 Tax=Periplaneta americana TaxID=6978 RepID=A0ABQ8TXP5_PERAM|nr:hypothetical protein ANN_02309 [Periplaneta americana]